MRTALWLLVVGLMVGVAAEAAEEPPPGLVAAVGDAVVILDAGEPIRLPVPPTAELLPGPGGQVLAADPGEGRTTVVDVARRRIGDWLDDARPRYFGGAGDRAVILDRGQIRLVSHPDGAVLARLDAPLERPVQVLVDEPTLLALVLDRGRDGAAPRLVVAQLQERQVSVRTLPPGVEALDLPPRTGLLLLVEPSDGRVRVVRPGAPGSVAEVRVPGGVAGAVLAEEGTVLVAAVAEADGGRLERWRLKPGRQGVEIRRLDPVPLPFAPRTIVASPDRRWVAVAGSSPEVAVVEVRRGRVRAHHALPEAPRQLLWVDLEGEAPLLPQWSEGVR